MNKKVNKKELIKLCELLSQSKYSSNIFSTLYDGVGYDFDEAYLISKYIKCKDFNEEDFKYACDNDNNLKFNFAFIDEHYLKFKNQSKHIDIRNKIFEALKISDVNEITRKLIIDNVYNKFKNHIYKGKDWYLRVYDENEITELRLDRIEAEKNGDYLNMDTDFKYDNKYYCMFLRNTKYKKKRR